MAPNEHDDSQRQSASYKMFLASYSGVAKPSELANLLEKQLRHTATPSTRKPLSTEAWAKYEGWLLSNTALWYSTEGVSKSSVLSGTCSIPTAPERFPREDGHPPRTAVSVQSKLL